MKLQTLKLDGILLRVSRQEVFLADYELDFVQFLYSPSERN